MRAIRCFKLHATILSAEGGSMGLSPAIVTHLDRLGAVLRNVHACDPVTALIQEVTWPDSTFDRRPDTEGPLVCGLRFLPSDSHGRFWDGWEKDFVAVDSARLFPLASDDYYFYFVATNANNPSDPLLYCVDHEEIDAEPFCGRFHTISELLSAIVAKLPE
jgi:hypothetical protein